MRALEIFLPTCLLMLGNQSMYQKFFSAKSEQDARRAVVGWIFGTVVLETIIVLIAMLGHSLAIQSGGHPFPREIIAYSALHHLPPWLGALLMGAVFAKVISTANNYLFSPATNLVNDVYVRYIQPGVSNRRALIVSRLMVALLGIWALYQALHTGSVLKATLYAYTIYSATLTPVVLAAFYSRRANANGAVSAIATGTLVTVFWDVPVVHARIAAWLPKIISERDAIFPALAVALFCLVVVSLLTPPPRREQIERFFPSDVPSSPA
jgi:SSS family solute:Na+ symporter/sodium/proline symporter